MRSEAKGARAGSGRLAAELLKGAAVGAAGIWILDRVDWFMVEHGDRDAWRRTQAVRPGGQDPAHVMAGMAAEALGAEPPRQPRPAGIAVHYGLGMLPGAAYALARRHLPGGPLGRGVLFGLTLFLVEDEMINPLIGAAAPPQRYPGQAHARGLVAHLVLGMVAEAALWALDHRRQGREQPRRGRDMRQARARARRPHRPGAPQRDAHGIRFAMQHDGKTHRVLVTSEALHKAEGAMTGGPVDQDELVAFEHRRPLLEGAARRKIESGAVEGDGSVRVTTLDLSSLGA